MTCDADVVTIVTGHDVSCFNVRTYATRKKQTRLPSITHLPAMKLGSLPANILPVAVTCKWASSIPLRDTASLTHGSSRFPIDFAASGSCVLISSSV